MKTIQDFLVKDSKNITKIDGDKARTIIGGWPAGAGTIWWGMNDEENGWN